MLFSSPAFAQDNRGAGEFISIFVASVGGALFGEIISDFSKQVDSGGGNADDPISLPSGNEPDPGVGNNGPNGVPPFDTPTNSGGG